MAHYQDSLSDFAITCYHAVSAMGSNRTDDPFHPRWVEDSAKSSMVPTLTKTQHRAMSVDDHIKLRRYILNLNFDTLLQRCLSTDPSNGHMASDSQDNLLNDSHFGCQFPDWYAARLKRQLRSRDAMPVGFPFLKLPAELRLKIYDDALEFSRPGDKVLRGRTVRLGADTIFLQPLFYVNRQIRNEALVYWLPEIKIEVRNTYQRLHRWLDAAPIPNTSPLAPNLAFKHLTHLSILKIRGSADWEPIGRAENSMASEIVSFEKLRYLKLQFVRYYSKPCGLRECKNAYDFIEMFSLEKLRKMRGLEQIVVELIFQDAWSVEITEWLEERMLLPEGE
jgi:hypothetical protein